jgi:aspartate racemase
MTIPCIRDHRIRLTGLQFFICMKTIGLIGGLTYVSTLEYYRLINEMVNEQLGGSEAAKLIIYSVNFGDIKKLTVAQDWAGIASLIGDAAKKTEKAGADCLLLGANTMHRIAPEIQEMMGIPLIHIASETAKAIQEKGMKKVALLGTKYTMELDFYHKNLAASGIESLIPSAPDIEIVNDVIYNELSKNQFLPASKQNYLRIINGLAAQGAEGVILGCTEIPLLIKPEDTTIPLFDTTRIHARAAVDFALNGQ